MSLCFLNIVGIHVLGNSFDSFEHENDSMLANERYIHANLWMILIHFDSVQSFLNFFVYFMGNGVLRHEQ